jgi:hypothetical protein
MKLLVSLVLIAVMFFILCLMSTIFGAAIGWAVGLLFGDTILDFLSRIGMNVNGVEMYQVGAALGFIGSFFRSSQTVNRNGK